MGRRGPPDPDRPLVSPRGPLSANGRRYLAAHLESYVYWSEEGAISIPVARELGAFIVQLRGEDAEPRGRDR